MTERIFLSSPDVGPTEEAAVVRAMRSGWIAPLGPDVEAFEQALAVQTERRYAVALSSGTAALHLALLNCGAGPGTVVITSTMTFAATANAITYTGADPVFVDCDLTGNMDVELLRSALQTLHCEGATIAAIVPVDLFGKVAGYDSIEEIATTHKIPVLADAAESLGASRQYRQAGSFGTAAALSFNGNKIITTSGGGALVTDDEAMAVRARYLATQARQHVVHYEHTDIGYNYRLSNILAALGIAQLSRLESMIEKRRSVREHYRELFRDVLGVEIFADAGGSGSEQSGTRDNCWLTSVLVDESEAGWKASDLMEHLALNNIEARPLWKPMHAQPVFGGRRSFLNGTSEKLFQGGLSLPSGSSLTPLQIDRITSCIRSFIKEGSTP